MFLIGEKIDVSHLQIEKLEQKAYYQFPLDTYTKS